MTLNIDNIHNAFQFREYPTTELISLVPANMDNLILSMAIAIAINQGGVYTFYKTVILPTMALLQSCKIVQ